jgi:ABC-type spermidine/putrescine transport system permease subunit II
MADQTDVIVAIITSAISLVTAVVTAIFVRKNDSRLKYLESLSRGKNHKLQ